MRAKLRRVRRSKEGDNGIAKVDQRRPEEPPLKEKRTDVKSKPINWSKELRERQTCATNLVEVAPLGEVAPPAIVECYMIQTPNPTRLPSRNLTKSVKKTQVVVKGSEKSPSLMKYANRNQLDIKTNLEPRPLPRKQNNLTVGNVNTAPTSRNYNQQIQHRNKNNNIISRPKIKHEKVIRKIYKKPMYPSACFNVKATPQMTRSVHFKSRPTKIVQRRTIKEPTHKAAQALRIKNKMKNRQNEHGNIQKPVPCKVKTRKVANKKPIKSRYMNDLKRIKNEAKLKLKMKENVAKNITSYRQKTVRKKAIAKKTSRSTSELKKPKRILGANRKTKFMRDSTYNQRFKQWCIHKHPELIQKLTQNFGGMLPTSTKVNNFTVHNIKLPSTKVNHFTVYNTKPKYKGFQKPLVIETRKKQKPSNVLQKKAPNIGKKNATNVDGKIKTKTLGIKKTQKPAIANRKKATVVRQKDANKLVKHKIRTIKTKTVAQRPKKVGKKRTKKVLKKTKRPSSQNDCSCRNCGRRRLKMTKPASCFPNVEFGKGDVLPLDMDSVPVERAMEMLNKTFLNFNTAAGEVSFRVK